jgi:ferredoxin
MKVKVNAKMCNGTGLCEQTCPEIFELRKGIATVTVNEVPADAEENCRQAANDCPTEAISIMED